MVAQLARTLAQDTTLDGLPGHHRRRAASPCADGSTEFAMDQGEVLDPTGVAGDVAAVRAARRAPGLGQPRRARGGLRPDGAVRDRASRSVGVNLAGSRVAGVLHRRRPVLLTEVRDADADVEQVLSGGTMTCCRPCGTTPTGSGWSTACRRRADLGAATASGCAGATCPASAGRTRRQVLVSRDGSRLVAVIDRPRSRPGGRQPAPVRHARPGSRRDAGPRDRVGGPGPALRARHRLVLADLHRGRPPAQRRPVPGPHHDGRRGSRRAVPGSRPPAGAARAMLVSSPRATDPSYVDTPSGLLDAWSEDCARGAPDERTHLPHLRRRLSSSTAAAPPVARRAVRLQIDGCPPSRPLRDAALDLLLGGRCVGCGRPGRALCPAAAPGCPTTAWPAWPEPDAARAGATVGRRPATTGLLRAALLAHKERHVAGLAAPLAACWLALSGPQPPTRRCCWSRCRAGPARRGPAATTRCSPSYAARRGWCRARPWRRCCAPAAGCATRPAFGAAERAANLRRLAVVPSAGLRRFAGRTGRVVVCDDVLTTGATAREAQRALAASGWTCAVAAVAATRGRRPAGPAGNCPGIRLSSTTGRGLASLHGVRPGPWLRRETPREPGASRRQADASRRRNGPRNPAPYMSGAGGSRCGLEVSPASTGHVRCGPAREKVSSGSASCESLSRRLWGRRPGRPGGLHLATSHNLRHRHGRLTWKLSSRVATSSSSSGSDRT